MPDDDDISPTAYGSLTPEKAFALVGNEVRSEILRALSDARSGDGNLSALSFSELRSRIDTDIDSSQFNYHLQQLVGHFIERTDEGDGQLVDRIVDRMDEGYVLRPEGTMLTRTIRAGTSAGRASLAPFELGLDCYFCGTAVEAMYKNAIFMAQCPDCNYLYEYDLTPPGVIGDDEQVVLEQISEYTRHRRLAFARGVCPLCANDLDMQFISPDETGYPRPDRRKVLLNRWCDHCGDRNYLKAGEVLLRDPALISFCYERGLDVTTIPIWKLEFAATDRFVTVRSSDPWKVALCLTLDDDTLELVIDGDLSITGRNYS
jgi:DNA-binding transcriptional ArsR family regulator